jgi:hypothetical protein
LQGNFQVKQMGQITSKAEFARMQGWNKSTVTRKAAAGQIVLTDDGRVDVEASTERLKLTRDPYKDGVRERHKRERQQRSGAVATSDAPRVDPSDTSYVLLQRARAEAEAHRAALLRMEREEKEGKLADTEAVRKHAFDAGRSARNAIFNLQHRLDPLLAGETDPAKRAALWDQELRSVCTELARACEQQHYGSH